MLLRNAHEGIEDMVLQIGSVGKLTHVDDRTQEKVTQKDECTLERNSHNF
jgi:hypothetical protein